MALANVNFKLDADVKKSMERACADMGLSMSAAFTIFAKKVGREDAYRLKSLLEILSMMRKMSGIWKRKWQITKRERLNLRSMS